MATSRSLEGLTWRMCSVHLPGTEWTRYGGKPVEAVFLVGVGLVSPDLAQVRSALLGSDEIKMLQRHKLTPKLGFRSSVYTWPSVTFCNMWHLTSKNFVKSLQFSKPIFFFVLVNLLGTTEEDGVKHRICRTLGNLSLDTDCCSAIHQQDVDIPAKIIALLNTTSNTDYQQTYLRSLR